MLTLVVALGSNESSFGEDTNVSSCINSVAIAIHVGNGILHSGYLILTL